MVTVSDGQVSVSVPVMLNVVKTYLPYFTMAIVLAIISAGVIMLIRRPPRKTLPGSILEGKIDLDRNEGQVESTMTEQRHGAADEKL